MGYRFTLESANTVANLSFGKVISCYRDIYSSRDRYEEFMQFLGKFHENMRSNEMEKYMRSIRRIRETLHRFEHYKCPINKAEYNEITFHFHREALDALHELSELFDRCVIKSLLLPQMSGNSEECCDDAFMTSEKILQRLVDRHPGDSCLILQPEERPRTTTIFDAFPNFEVALRQADLWPAVFFWDGSEDFAFVPIKHEDELRYLYEIVRYERHPIGEIKRIAEKKKTPSRYIFQLSDLHFGAKHVDVMQRRLKSLVKTQLSTVEMEDSIAFVISGDAVDSPTLATENEYRDFAKYLEERCGQEPIRILGNHDINNHGLAISHGRQHIANIVGDYPKIKILDESKVLLLLFNSNTNGQWAKGEIGTSQMAAMGNKLDAVENLADYLLIAVLHHHLLPIAHPEHYDKKWYKKILPETFVDETLKLIDDELFLDWLKQRNVRFVLHGHKHIPFMKEHAGITVISCGSSTGQITHKEKGKTYLSYNLIKISEKAVTCSLFAEEVLGAGAKNILTEVVPI